MAAKPDFLDKVRELARREGRYDAQAYLFVFEALEYTLKRLGKRRHVTGRELVNSMRDFALRNFGAMGKVVFNQWGVTETGDFGKIVFSLVAEDLMSKTDQDTIDDFLQGFDFAEVFERDYVPADLAGEGGSEGGN